MKDLHIELNRIKRDSGKVSKVFKTEKTYKEKKNLKNLLISFSILFILTLIVFVYIFVTDNTEKEYERIPIAVIDFINETNEAELNGLSGMLITALEQSKRLTVLTRSRMFDILKQLKISEIERIDESTGRKICKQANIHTLATATIRKFGKLYTIDFKVLNVDKNEYLFTTKEQGEGQESIPAMIDNLSENVREKLKEKASEIKANPAKVAEITSANLEAYQHYFKGQEFIDKLRFDLAREEFKKAIELDSTFGLAYYRLAYAIDWEMHPKHSAQYITNAISFLDRIPEKEKYLARALATNLYEGRREAIEVLAEMENIYPNDKEMLYNIGDWSFHLGEYEKAKQYLEKVISIDSTFVRALQHLTWTYREMGLYEEMIKVAKNYVAVSESEDSFNSLAEAYMLTGAYESGLKWLEHQREQNPGRYFLNCSFAGIYFLQGQYDKAEEEIEILIEKNKPANVQEMGYKYIAYWYAYTGKYRLAVKACEYLIDFYVHKRDTSLASFWRVVKGLQIYGGWNDVEGAWKEVEKTFPLQEQIDYVLYWTTLPLIYVAHGDYTLAERLTASSPEWWQLSIKALIHTENHECEKTESLADSTIQVWPGYSKILVLYHLAQCHYQQGQFDKAQKCLLELQSIYDTSFGLRAWYFPKSFYLLGKIYEQKGELELALKNYNKFLEIWKNADKDLPQLLDAKKRKQNLTTKFEND
jgi:tetratricopeptide (TPR) repeat protein